MANLLELLNKSKVEYFTSTHPSDLEKLHISGLASDSRAVSQDNLFFAIPGHKDNGQRYIKEAQEKGARAIVTLDGLESINCNLPVIYVNNIQEAVSDIAVTYYGDPSKNLLLIAVTGTNGKTSIAWILSHMLSALEYPSSMLGTLGAAPTIPLKESNSIIQTSNTTPGAIDIQKFLNEVKNAGRRSLVMEVTSHALVQDRVRGVSWDVAVFTNLTRDHLDYHTTFEEYGDAKAKLFKSELGKSKKSKKVSVINIDDAFGEKLYNDLKSDFSSFECLSVSTQKKTADLFLIKKNCSLHGTEMFINIAGNEFIFYTQLVGSYNVYNTILSIAALYGLGFDIEEVSSALKQVSPVCGRLERLNIPGLKFEVFVDYAHTPDALENVLSSLREVTKGELITVFGCGGDRDRGKRPLMGRAVRNFSDCAIVTSDNPRTENPEKIIDDIIPGFEGQATDFYWERNEDRRAAIRRAMELAKPGDAIVIAGKGHEDYQEINGVKYPFSDQQECYKLAQEVFSTSS